MKPRNDLRPPAATQSARCIEFLLCITPGTVHALLDAFCVEYEFLFGVTDL